MPKRPQRTAPKLLELRYSASGPTAVIPYHDQLETRLAGTQTKVNTYL